MVVDDNSPSGSERSEQVEPTVSPESLLGRLRDEATDAETQAEQLRALSEQLVADLDVLNASNEERAQAASGYEQTRTQLAQRRSELASGVDELRRLIGSSADDAGLDTAWDAIRSDLDQLETARQKLEETHQKAAAAHADAGNKANEAQAAFDDLRQYPTSFEENLQRADQLRGDAEAARGEERNRAYVLLKAFDAAWPPEPKDLDTYRTELDAAWRALYGAQNGLREADAARVQAEDELKRNDENIADLRDNRVDKTLERAAAAASEGSTAQSTAQAATPEAPKHDGPPSNCG